MSEDSNGARLSRRTVVLRLAGLSAAPALAGCVVAPPGHVYTPRAGTGFNDADPGDAPGHGRGGYRGRANTGYTDADPGDGPGYGRGGYRGYRARSGYTDSDPGDGPGHGRGGSRHRRVTDSDPRDAPGRGRGW